MQRQFGAALAMSMIVAAIVSVAVISGGSAEPPEPKAAVAGSDRGTASRLRARFGGALEDCSTRSEANFPGAASSARNLIVGPLVLIGGAFTDADTVRDFGGNKFPLLVKPGHTVTVRLAGRGRRVAGLAYGPLPQGRETTLRDTYRRGFDPGS